MSESKGESSFKETDFSVVFVVEQQGLLIYPVQSLLGGISHYTTSRVFGFQGSGASPERAEEELKRKIRHFLQKSLELREATIG